MSRESPLIQKTAQEIEDKGKIQGKSKEEIRKDIDRGIEELKKRSLEEKKKGYIGYRGELEWAGIETQEDWDNLKQKALEGYVTGRFFIERIGRYREVDPTLAATFLNIRQAWIEEYDVKTVPELILLDMALMSYYHCLRINTEIGDLEGSIEWDYFMLNAPTKTATKKEANIRTFETTGEGESRARVEGLVDRLKENLLPSLDRFNRMFIRNLKALRDLKRANIQLNIGQVGQLNIAEKQINVSK
ncbi:hypothetical protein ES707_21465 [subsurface metagenome]